MEWTPLSQAQSQVAAWEGVERSREKLIEYLQQGIIAARCARAKCEGRAMRSEADSPKGIRNDWHFHCSGRFMDQLLGTAEIKAKFWRPIHSESDKDWIFGEFIHPEMAFVDWDRGEVRSFYAESIKGHAGDDFYGMFITAYGVELNAAHLNAVAPLRSQSPSNEPTARSSKFNWEAAFADVAARLYHDLQFENLEALGVQTAIIDALRQSFERRKLPVPEETSLKNKARIILGALRAK